MPLIKPDYRQAVCAQGMKSVVDRDFRRTMLMGSMWVSCSTIKSTGLRETESLSAHADLFRVEPATAMYVLMRVKSISRWPVSGVFGETVVNRACSGIS